MEDGTKKRVLIVDDEHLIADTLAIILNKAGFDASAVYCGKDAIEVAQKLRPDLIISDVVMPDISGVEVAIRIREFLPNCKMILFSGQSGTMDLLESARDKGHEFEVLAKPVPPRELINKLKS